MADVKTASIFRDHLLRDQVALVTGGGSGICLRIAERFAEHGAKVALVGRTQEKLDQAAAGIHQAGGEAVGFAADVREYKALESALRQTRERYGEIDILVCGAAGNFPAPALAALRTNICGSPEHRSSPFRPHTRSGPFRCRLTSAREKQA